MVRKELHLDSKIIETLEKEAKLENRSLKNYLENLIIEQAKRLNPPSKEYMNMMDDLLERFDSNNIEFSSINEVNKRNGIPN
jgi:sugar-specific transcriptional regulator TrmB